MTDPVRSDEAWMRLALEQAARGPAADPNPRVGCVLVDAAGQLLGAGHHRGAGTAHAEVDALEVARSAGHDVTGATAHVTLEPCRHTGRTGPCAEALRSAGVARVVIAAPDPSAVAGGGADLLRAAGVEVVTGVLTREARALVRHWEHAVTTGRPFVTWKYAATLDGRSAAPDGTSQWITGEEARADVHARRATAGAVVVGTGTVLADDPRLTVRVPGEGSVDGAAVVGAEAPASRQPLRVVVGERDVPAAARVRTGGGVDPTGDGYLHLRTHDPAEVLRALHAREVRHVWLEGGPTLAGAFLRAGLVDEVIAYVAPDVLGAGAAAVALPDTRTLTDRVRLELIDVDRLGRDIRLTARPAPVRAHGADAPVPSERTVPTQTPPPTAPEEA